MSNVPETKEIIEKCFPFVKHAESKDFCVEHDDSILTVLAKAVYAKLTDQKQVSSLLIQVLGRDKNKVFASRVSLTKKQLERLEWTEYILVDLEGPTDDSRDERFIHHVHALKLLASAIINQNKKDF